MLILQSTYEQAKVYAIQNELIQPVLFQSAYVSEPPFDLIRVGIQFVLIPQPSDYCLVAVKSTFSKFSVVFPPQLVEGMMAVFSVINALFKPMVVIRAAASLLFPIL